MAGVPITIEVTEGDNRPILEWQIVDTNGAPIDISDADKHVHLYYRISGSTVTSWKKTDLTKSDAANGKVQFTADGSNPFYISGQTGVIDCEGELRYIDNDTGVDVRIRDVLVTKVHPKFPEP